MDNTVWLTVPETAKKLDVTDQTVYHAIRDGRLKSAIMSPQAGKRGAWRIAEYEVDDYIRNGDFLKPSGNAAKVQKIPDKIFISTPMAGKPDCMILDTIAETARNGEAPDDHYISGYRSEQPPRKYKHPELWYLAKSIMRMADCDEVVFTPGWESARGCLIERLVYDFYFKGYKDFMVGDIIRAENDAREITKPRKRGKKHAQ